ncbi:response regulator [Paenibacillus sp. BK720]|uniref:response regulator transcription factor n=1 Tax=Paenibacillus sp. BK720 TaxID=2587092 RepID=UPI001422F875|nr:response regulator [Paenibacillus sp. BK720]NIK70757.1 two-component system response regulator YesN [Paenibacillus sp. BK720]
MYNVLVVDDEPFMLEGWRTMVDWESHGFRLCWAVSDGREALEVMEREVPDLVFTDLQMPVMDGLELIRQMKQSQRLKEIKTVIVSGYSRFDAAQFAIRHQIEQYLLKPLIEEEIHELLDSLRVDMDQRNSMEASASESLSIVFARALQEEDEEARTALLSHLDCLPEAAGRLIVLDVTGGKPGPTMEEVEAELTGLPAGSRCMEEPSGSTGLLVWSRQQDGLEEGLDSDVRRIAERLSGRWPYCSIYVSGETQGWRHLKQLYTQLQELRSRGLYKGRAGVFWYEHRDEHTHWRWEDAASRAEALLAAVERNNVSAIEKAASALVEFVEGTNKPASSLAASLSYLQGGLLRAYHKAGGDPANPPEWILPQYGLVGNVREQLSAACLQAAGEIDELNGKKPEGRLQEAVAYVTAHYREKLQLKELAELFSLNPVYMGQQFKRVTGYCFNDYMHLLRIKEAKKLLLRTDLKVSTIANELGYHSTEYFGSVFKSLTKVSPSAYKSNQKGIVLSDEQAVSE